MPLTACPLSSHGWGGTGAPHPSPVHRVPTLPLPPMAPHAGVDKIAKQKSKRYSFSNGRGWGSTVAGHADGPTPHRFPQPLPQPSRPPAHAPRARPVPPAPTVPAGSSLPPPPAGGGPRAAANATHGACRPPLPARGGVGSPPRGARSVADARHRRGSAAPRTALPPVAAARLVVGVDARPRPPPLTRASRAAQRRAAPARTPSERRRRPPPPPPQHRHTPVGAPPRQRVWVACAWPARCRHGSRPTVPRRGSTRAPPASARPAATSPVSGAPILFLRGPSQGAHPTRRLDDTARCA